MKATRPYSFEEFESHRAAMPQVMQWEYIQLTNPPTEVGTQQTHFARSGRIIEYFHDSYPDQHEAVEKSMLFMAIHEYISEHFRSFKRHGLLNASANKEQVLLSQGLLRAVHFAVTKLGVHSSISPRRVIKLAKAFDAIAPTA